MKIYTSYFYQVRNFPTNLIGLSTAIWNPKYIQFGKRDSRGVLCIDCPPFKPGKQCVGLCDGNCRIKRPEICKFLSAYYLQLSQIDFNSMMKKLIELNKKIKEIDNIDSDFCFLVYEKYDNPCSERGAIQKYFRENGVEISEWKSAEEK